MGPGKICPSSAPAPEVTSGTRGWGSLLSWQCKDLKGWGYLTAGDRQDKTSAARRHKTSAARRHQPCSSWTGYRDESLQPQLTPTQGLVLQSEQCLQPSPPLLHTASPSPCCPCCPRCPRSPPYLPAARVPAATPPWPWRRAQGQELAARFESRRRAASSQLQPAGRGSGQELAAGASAAAHCPAAAPLPSPLCWRGRGLHGPTSVCPPCRYAPRVPQR